MVKLDFRPPFVGFPWESSLNLKNPQESSPFMPFDVDDTGHGIWCTSFIVGGSAKFQFSFVFTPRKRVPDLPLLF